MYSSPVYIGIVAMYLLKIVYIDFHTFPFTGLWNYDEGLLLGYKFCN